MFKLTVAVSGILPTSRLANVADAVYSQALKDAGKLGLRRLLSRMARENINASEETAKQLEVTAPIRESLDRISVEVSAFGDRARILQFIEYGRRPGAMPPIYAIVQWMQDKGIAGGDTSPKHLLELAGAIARKIAQFGTQGHYLFTKTADNLEDDPELIAIFSAATQQIASIINSDVN